ncbi:hypothetical protein CEXT_627271 [Caerostris extrusa]|uniref:Uncharacterized protein n=1 Tax=Caerostris extrusa TaxID=172846 RepID=A0AAV4R0J9_CAEEX|nr:hypothetical protein CEXT_627271 [Caerostris extrusa]
MKCLLRAIVEWMLFHQIDTPTFVHKLGFQEVLFFFPFLSWVGDKHHMEDSIDHLWSPGSHRTGVFQPSWFNDRLSVAIFCPVVEGRMQGVVFLLGEFVS